MNMVFLQLWLFQGFNYSSECRLMNMGDQPSRDGTYKPDWILLNAF